MDTEGESSYRERREALDIDAYSGDGEKEDREGTSIPHSTTLQDNFQNTTSKPSEQSLKSDSGETNLQ